MTVAKFSDAEKPGPKPSHNPPKEERAGFPVRWGGSWERGPRTK